MIFYWCCETSVHFSHLVFVTCACSCLLSSFSEMWWSVAFREVVLSFPYLTYWALQGFTREFVTHCCACIIFVSPYTRHPVTDIHYVPCANKWTACIVACWCGPVCAHSYKLFNSNRHPPASVIIYHGMDSTSMGSTNLTNVALLLTSLLHAMWMVATLCCGTGLFRCVEYDARWKTNCAQGTRGLKTLRQSCGQQNRQQQNGNNDTKRSVFPTNSLTPIILLTCWVNSIFFFR
jgi:hypothetical protein